MAKRKESHGELDWASAEVDDGTLTVPLTGEPSKAWAERAAGVVERLGGGRGWGDTRITRDKVTVGDVQAGAEIDVRHFLEGAVMQANADFAPAEEADATGDEPSGPDAEMTQAFRAFAPEEPESEHDD